MKNLSKKSTEELLRSRFGDNLKDHFPLSSVIPIKVGGVGYMFLEANTTADLVDAAKISIENKLPYVAIGGGTAVIVGESGFPGLVIKNNTKNAYRISGSSRVVCDSGVENSNVVNSMASIGLGGIEFLDSIPGTVGGAIISNAELGDRMILSYVKEISMFDPDSEKIIKVTKPEFESIRTTISNNSLVHPPIILTVTLQFARLAQDEIIRRLSLIKKNFRQSRGRSLGYVFSQKLSDVRIKKEPLRQLKLLNVSYDKIIDRFYLGNTCTPKQLKGAINVISKEARGYGIETVERITYLGYYQGEDDE